MKNKIKEQKVKRVVWLQIKHNQDLLKAISEHCKANNINKGVVFAIGALQRAKFSYYNQKEKKFYKRSIEKPVEIISCVGNVSVKDEEPFVHAHISVSDSNGNMLGGHLEEGCVVFASECCVFEMQEDLLKREFDKLTGLSLWNFKNA